MRIIHTSYLNDGKRYNDGRSVDLIQIENPKDYDTLMNNILETDYYGNKYLSGHLKSEKFKIKQENVNLAALIHFLQPRSLLELGCAQGEVLFLLDQAGFENAHGVDLSQEMTETAFPELKGKIDTGDILDKCAEYQEQGRKFDFFCGFDIWEHIHPGKIDEYIEAILGIAEDDALVFCITPAFGEDEVFGEVFPTEFAENQEDFDERRPFRHFIAEHTDPIIPVNGHLIWAHTQWWEDMFTSHGMVREKGLERLIHKFFDRYLYDTQQTFFLFRRDTAAAGQRVEQLLANDLSWLDMWRIYIVYYRALQRYERETGRQIVDAASVNHKFDDIIDCYYESLEKRLAKLNQHDDHIAALETAITQLGGRVGYKSLPRRVVGKLLPESIKRLLR